jgi:hypothetical protein
LNLCKLIKKEEKKMTFSREYHADIQTVDSRPKSGVIKEEVYVFTPKNSAIDEAIDRSNADKRELKEVDPYIMMNSLF